VRKTPEPKIKFQIGDLFINKHTNTMWYIVDIDVAYIAISYLNSINITGIEYITKHYTEQSINDKRFIYYPVKNNDI
jgi:hypothetical protein